MEKVFKVDYSNCKEHKKEDVERIEGLVELDGVTYILSIKSLGLIGLSLTKT